jgi:sugar O-acyltransferase (sialic acid O-acetyltransferase NeuD family)
MDMQLLKDSRETTNLFIYGASGHGKVILDILRANHLVVRGFIDDDISKKNFAGLHVFRSHQINPESDQIIIGIGNNKTRKYISEMHDCKIAVAIHPTAIVSPDTQIDGGTVIMQMAVIQPGTKIGKHCIVNTKASVDHDCHLGDYVHISPGATLCGNVTIGDLTWVGAGATIIQNITIGANVIIGAGAVVLRDVPDNVKVFGNPGRVVMPHPKEIVT